MIRFGVLSSGDTSSLLLPLPTAQMALSSHAFITHRYRIITYTTHTTTGAWDTSALPKSPSRESGWVLGWLEMAFNVQREPQKPGELLPHPGWSRALKPHPGWDLPSN